MNRKNWLILLLTMLASWAVAQDTTYRLQPEDILRIQIYNEQQVNAVIPVGKDGNISAPFIGIVRAQGKTTSELEADLVQEYVKKLRLRDPRISVTIERYRESRAVVGGMVARPGPVLVRPNDTILTILNSAGGPMQDGRADLRRAVLRRAGAKELIPIDLYAMTIQGNLSQNYLVEDGDELLVPEETRNRILVTGSIQGPGTFPFKEPMTVMDALSLARGEIRYESKFSDIVVIRERRGEPGKFERIKSNIVAFMTKNDASQNVALRAGDIVYVPATKSPDVNRLSSFATGIANAFFILDRFGVNILGGRR